MKKSLQNKIKAAAISLFIVGISTQSVVEAQIITPDENQGVLAIQQFDTRSVSMGNATVSDLYGRASIGINPALSGLYINRTVFQINTHYNRNINMLQYSLMLPTISIQNHHFTTNVGFLNRGFSKFVNSRYQTPDVNFYHAELAYAYSIAEVFSLGVLQSVTNAFNDDAKFLTYFTNLGLVYAPAENISYGMVVRGLGYEVNYEINESGTTTLERNLMQQSIELGATFRFPTEERTYLVMSFANEKRFGEKGLWYKAGIELIPVSFISFRGGALFHDRNSSFAPRAGIGLNFNFASIDYAIAPKKMSGEYFHQLGITIQF